MLTTEQTAEMLSLQASLAYSAAGRDRATCKPSIAKSLFDATPPAMAEWLVEVARRSLALDAGKVAA